MKTNIKKRKLQLIALSLLLIFFLCLLLNFPLKKEEEFSLFLDGQARRLKPSPKLKNQRVYLPLLETMEVLGYEADLDIENYRFEFNNEDRSIVYRHGKTYGYVNKKFTHIYMPTFFYKGVVYASVETIEKLTSAFIKTLEETREIHIESPPEIQLADYDNLLHLSTYNKKYQILGRLVRDKLFLSGSIKEGDYWRLEGIGERNKLTLREEPIRYDKFEESIQLLKTGQANKLTVNASRRQAGFDHPVHMTVVPRYDQEVFSLDPLEHEAIYNRHLDEFVFANPKNYIENLGLYNDHGLYNPQHFLSLDFIKKPEERKVFRQLALDITKEVDNDYDRALAIHNWLVQNLAYDYQKYFSGDWSGQDPYQALEEGKTLCEGFSFLYMALCRSIDLPTKTVFGFAGDLNLTRDELEHSRYGHAWNEVFVDNRWIIVDTTWDTKNTYNSGFFIKNTNSFLFFDVSLQQLSNTHLIELYPIY